MKSVASVTSIYILGNIYILNNISQTIPATPLGHILMLVLGIFLVISLPLFFLIGEKLSINFASFIYRIGTAWLIFMLYLFILFLIKDLIGLTHLIAKENFDHYTQHNWFAFGAILLYLVVLMGAGYWHYRDKKRVEINLFTNKALADNDNLRIVAISDLHLGYTIGNQELKKWIELINKERPDVVIIAGDIVDNSARPLMAANTAACFNEIKAPLGIYACLGNHDYRDLSETLIFLKNAGIKLLRDQSELVGNSFYIIGRDDLTHKRRLPLSYLVKDLDKNKMMILLDHQPHKLEDAEANEIDFQFSGHTHNGQVYPLSLITKKIFENSFGLLKKGQTHIYVSSGVGIWGGKFRIGTQSEYVVVNIKRISE